VEEDQLMDLTSAQTWGVLYVISGWFIRLVMLVVVPFRRSPEAAKGWLLLVLFEPWVGLVLYLVIGRPKYPWWRAERFDRLPGVFQPVRQRLQKSLQRFHPALPALRSPATVLVQNLGNLELLGENAVELLADYDSAIDRLVADIDQAADHVHLLYYIFADDATGMKVVAALERAVKRGVVCRVLVDFLGSRPWSRSLGQKLAALGIAVHRILPVSFWQRNFARADLRNHRKVAVVDGRVAYTGSQNLVDAIFKAGITYEELVVRVTGPVVLELQAIFVADWFLETEETLGTPNVFPEPVAAGSASAQVLPSGPDYPATNVQRLVVALVHGAEERIVITTPYLIPDDALLQALETAVRRGVEVHLVVSRLADQLLVSLAQQSYYEQMLEAGIRIHRYRGKFLHAKHLSIDNAVAVIGSSNMDIRSFVLNAEVSLVVYDRDVTARLYAQQEHYFAASDLLSPKVWANRPLVAKVCENLARLISPLL
jgi:cardiolipin synthase